MNFIESYVLGLMILAVGFVVFPIGIFALLWLISIFGMGILLFFIFTLVPGVLIYGLSNAPKKKGKRC